MQLKLKRRLSGVKSFLREVIADIQTQEVRLSLKFLSEFPRAKNWQELITSESELLFIPDQKCDPESTLGYQYHREHFLNDLNMVGTYCLALKDAIVIPWQSLRGTGQNQFQESHLFKDTKVYGMANMLITNDGKIIADSFLRTRAYPPCLHQKEPGNFSIAYHGPTTYVEDVSLYYELVSGHFGHLLVDTPARLWPLADPALNLSNSVSFHGFPFQTHGNRPGDWPLWMRTVLDAYKLQTANLRFINGPTKFKRLIVPSRISPFFDNLNHRYRDFMVKAAERILSDRPQSPAEDQNLGKRKIFLSRSRLSLGRRELPISQARWLDETLKGMDYAIVHPQELSIEDQIRIIRGATHIVSCVGSQLHLLVFSKSPTSNVFRITTSAFADKTDHQIAKLFGANVRDYEVSCEVQTDRPKDECAWQFEAGDFQRLPEAIEAWEAETGA